MCSGKYPDLRQCNRRPRRFIDLFTYRDSEEEELGKTCSMHGTDDTCLQTTGEIQALVLREIQALVLRD